MVKLIKRFLIGFTVFILNITTTFLIVYGVGALELSKGIEFALFIAPVTYVSLVSFYFLIKVKC